MKLTECYRRGRKGRKFHLQNKKDKRSEVRKNEDKEHR
jgi:hypothetical protein